MKNSKNRSRSKKSTREQKVEQLPLEALEVENFDNLVGEDGLEPARHFLLPKQPCRIIISGDSGSGKTNLLLNFVFKWLNFDRLYLYSKSLDQPKYVKIIDDITALEDLVEEKTGERPEILHMGITSDDILPVEEFDPEFRNLVIFDDFLTEPNQKPITDIFVRGRNQRVSVLYLTQSYFPVPRTLRKQATHVALFGLSDLGEVHRLHRQNAKDVSRDKFVKMFNEATSKRFDFFWIDKNAEHRCLKYRQKLTGLLCEEI